MEYASYLAGEGWSDHPACTHPLPAELARQVNDFTSDEARHELVEVVPDVIGLIGSDLRIDLRIALRGARTALPVAAAEERQQVMVTAVLTCERLLADLDGCAGAPLSQESGDALALAPGAARWARRYTRNVSISHQTLRRQAAPTIVRCRGGNRARVHTRPGLGPARPARGGDRGLQAVHTPEPRGSTSRNGQVVTTWSPSAAKAAATLSGQITA